MIQATLHEVEEALAGNENMFAVLTRPGLETTFRLGRVVSWGGIPLRLFE
jgi:hypothetical protein